MQCLYTTALLFLIPSMSFATSVKDFTANYAVYKNNFYLGTSKRTLTTDKNILTFSSLTETAGIAALFFDVLIKETSKLILEKDSLNIYSYNYDEKQKDKQVIHQLYIDDSRLLYNSFTKEQYPVTQDMHDGLGFSIAMMHDLKKGKRSLTYTIAEKKYLKTYQLKFIGEEKLYSNNDIVNTLKIEHFDPQSKHRFTFWCAKSMDFLPIRIRNTKKNGNEILLNMTQHNQKDFYFSLEDDKNFD